MDAGTEALLSLISHDKSGKSSSINDLSDNIYMWMRSAVSSNKGLVDLEGSCLEATPILRKATDEADHTNLLIESWSLYLSSELFVTEFQALDTSTIIYHVAIPSLHGKKQPSWATPNLPGSLP